MEILSFLNDLSTAVSRTNGALRAQLAIGNYGRFLATEDATYFRLAREDLAEAERLGANTDRARDFMERYQL